MPSPPEEMLKKHLVFFGTSIDSEIISGAYEPRFKLYALGTANGYLYIINEKHITFRSPKNVNYPLLKLVSLPNSSSFFSICSKTMFEKHTSRCEKPNPHNLVMLNSIKPSKIENICTHWIIKPDRILSRTVPLEFDIVDIALSPVHPEFALFLTKEGSIYGFSIETLNFTNLYINIFGSKPVKSICWSSGYRYLVAHKIIEGIDVQKLEIGTQYNIDAQTVDSIDNFTAVINSKGIPNLLMFTNSVSSIDVPKGSRAIYCGMLNGSNWITILRSDKGDSIYENRNPKILLKNEHVIPQSLINYEKPFERSQPKEVAFSTDYGRFIYLDGRVIDHFSFDIPDLKFAFADMDDIFVFSIDHDAKIPPKPKKEKKKKDVNKKKEEEAKKKEEEAKKKEEEAKKKEEEAKKREEEESKKKEEEESKKKEEEAKKKEEEKKKKEEEAKKKEEEEKKKDEESEKKEEDENDDSKTKEEAEDKKEENEKEEKSEGEKEANPPKEESKDDDSRSKDGKSAAKEESKEDAAKDELAGSKKGEQESKKPDGPTPPKSPSEDPESDEEEEDDSDPVVYSVSHYRRGILCGRFSLNSCQITKSPLGVSHDKVLFVENRNDVCFFDIKTSRKTVLRTLTKLVRVRHTKRRFPDFVQSDGAVFKCKATDDGFELFESDQKCPSRSIVDWRLFKDSMVYITDENRLVFKESSKKILKNINERVVAFEVVNFLGRSPKEGDEEFVIVVTSARVLVLDFNESEKKMRKIRKVKFSSIFNATFTKFGTLILHASDELLMLPLPDVSSGPIDKIPISKDGKALLVHKLGAYLVEPNSVAFFLDNFESPKMFDQNAPVLETPKVNKFLKLFGKKDDTMRDADEAFQYSRSSGAMAKISETQEVMQMLLVKANERGELLNEMEIKSSRILTSAQKFHQLAKELKNRPWF